MPIPDILSLFGSSQTFYENVVIRSSHENPDIFHAGLYFTLPLHIYLILACTFQCVSKHFVVVSTKTHAQKADIPSVDGVPREENSLNSPRVNWLMYVEASKHQYIILLTQTEKLVIVQRPIPS